MIIFNIIININIIFNFQTQQSTAESINNKRPLGDQDLFGNIDDINLEDEECKYSNIGKLINTYITVKFQQCIFTIWSSGLVETVGLLKEYFLVVSQVITVLIDNENVTITGYFSKL